LQGRTTPSRKATTAFRIRAVKQERIDLSCESLSIWEGPPHDKCSTDRIAEKSSGQSEL
jgi:hypothetical protein